MPSAKTLFRMTSLCTGLPGVILMLDSVKPSVVIGVVLLIWSNNMWDVAMRSDKSNSSHQE